MSMTGILLILVAALILFGPDELPRIARSVGKVVGQVQRIYQGYSKEFREMIDESAKDVKSIGTELSKSMTDLTSLPDAVIENKSSTDSSVINDDQSGVAVSDSAEVLLRYEDSVKGREADAKAPNPLHDLPEELVLDKRSSE